TCASGSHLRKASECIHIVVNDHLTRDSDLATIAVQLIGLFAFSNGTFFKFSVLALFLEFREITESQSSFGFKVTQRNSANEGLKCLRLFSISRLETAVDGRSEKFREIAGAQSTRDNFV